MSVWQQIVVGGAIDWIKQKRDSDVESTMS